MTFQYTDYDAIGLAELIRQKQVSAQEVLEAAILQIEQHNPNLNAVVVKLYDQARQQLTYLDSDLPFAGVPFLLKDLLADYAGIPTSFGSRWLKNHPVAQHGELVKRYIQAGLIIVGKTNVPEFGLGAITEPELFGPAINPRISTHTPGGSSGGSAVAVAAKMVPAAHGNDGGGSIRIPAACCGLIGLKPTRGLTPSASCSLLSGWNGLIVEHAITRTVRDSAALLDVATAQPSFHYLSSLKQANKPLKIGYTMQPFLSEHAIQAENAAAVNKTLYYAQFLQHQVQECNLTLDIEALQNAYVVMVVAELNLSLQQLAQQVGRGPKKGEIETVTAVVKNFSYHFTAVDYARSIQVMDKATKQLNAALQTVDILLTPVLSTPPVKLGELQPKWYERLLLELIYYCPWAWVMKFLEKQFYEKMFGYVSFTPLCNMTGHPAIALPLYQTQEHLPIGVQFIAKHGQEVQLLQLAKQFEEAGFFIQ